MSAADLPDDVFAALESAVAFRLFADQAEPTLSVPEQIAGCVGERILSNAMRPGERIGEQELATEFNVSRGPVREALRILERSPLARLAVLNVLKLNRIALDQTLDEEGNNKHVQRLVCLKDWARPMQLAQERLTFHVLEAIDPAETILDYARVNNVDHIVMGARANSTMRKLLGSVSAKVAAEAPCSVTVVRNRAAAGEG